MTTGSETLLNAAHTIVQRGLIYGDAASNMATTARLWSVVLGVEVTAPQVALCMIQLKVARLLVTPSHNDSTVDIAGYAAVLRECQVRL